MKEVSQVDEIAVLPFVSNSDVFDHLHVSLLELRCQHPRYASDFVATHQSKKIIRVKYFHEVFVIQSDTDGIN